MADTNRVSLAYVEESVYGVTPSGPPTLKDLRFTGESLIQNTTTVLSNEIRSDRQNVDVIRTSIAAAGDINFEMSHGAYDDFLVAALLSAAFSAQITTGPLTTLSTTSPSTITRSSGSFSADGYLVGQWIRVSGFANAANNGHFKLATVGTTTMTVVQATLVTEGVGPAVTIKQGSQIVNGVTFKSFAIEKKYTDLASEFAILNGMAIQTLAITVAADQIVTGSFGFIGKKETSATTTAGTGTNTPAPTDAVMNGVDHVKPVYEAGVAIGIVGGTINLNNNLRTRLQVGTLGAISIGTGSVDVTATLQMYFATKAIMDKYLNQTVSNVAVAFDDGAKSYVIEFPQLKYTAGRRVAGGKNQDVIADMALTGYRNPTENVSVRIARFS